MDDDDDVPPPLSSFEDQIDALEGKVKTATIDDESLTVAGTFYCPSKEEKTNTKSNGIKKGFFSNKPDKPKAQRKVAVATSKAAPQEEQEEIIHLKANIKANSKSIPEGFKIEPSEEEKKYQKYKEDLIEKLKPTPDMMGKISQDNLLMAGFDDPEVMAAVNDISKNPQNFKKYAKNPKIVQFYSAMGKMMGEKLEKDGVQKP